MHLVLRSTQAVGSFRQPRNFQRIDALIRKFAARFGVRILDYANNHNHLHLHIKLRCRQDYTPFIRALTAAIAVAIDGRSRWRKAKAKFWDRRPFSRIARGADARNRLSNYILLNRMEAVGCLREAARRILKFGGIHYAYG